MKKKFFIIVLIVLAVTALSLANIDVLSIAGSALAGFVLGAVLGAVLGWNAHKSSVNVASGVQPSEPSQQPNTTQS